MSKTILASLLATSLVMAGSSALAASFTEDFSTPYDPVANGSLGPSWYVASAAQLNGFVAEIADGRLAVSLTPQVNGQTNNVWVIPTFTTEGDFRMEVTMDASSLISVDVHGGVSVNFGAGNSVQIGAKTEPSPTLFGGFYDLLTQTDYPSAEAAVGGPITLRVERTGSTVTEWYATPGGTFNFLNSLTDDNLLGEAQFFLSINAYPGRVGQSVYFDNFSVTSVPEPAAYLLFAAGIAVLSAVAARRRA